MKFEITNHGESNTEAIDQAYQQAERGREMDDDEEEDEDEKLTPAQEEPKQDDANKENPAQQNNEEKTLQTVDLDANKEEGETEGSVANATVSR